MKDEIKYLRESLPDMKTVEQSIFFTEKIENMIDALNEQIEMLENSLLVLRNDLSSYALKYSIDLSQDNQ